MVCRQTLFPMPQMLFFFFFFYKYSQRYTLTAQAKTTITFKTITFSPITEKALLQFKRLVFGGERHDNYSFCFFVHMA